MMYRIFLLAVAALALTLAHRSPPRPLVVAAAKVV